MSTEKTTSHVEVPVVDVATNLLNGAINTNVEYRQQLWGTGLCECTSDTANCWDVVLCQPCVLAQQYNMVLNNRQGMNWPVFLTSFLCDIFLTNGLVTLAELVYIRVSLRQRYHISPRVFMGRPPVTEVDQEVDANGASANDCHSFTLVFGEIMSLLLCTSCAVCQNHRELTLHGQWPGKILFGKDPALVTGTIVEIPGETHLV